MKANRSAGEAIHRFTVADYHRMGEAGVFDAEARVELVDGVVTDKPPVSTPHLLAVNRLNTLLTPLMVGRAVVSVRNPLRLDGWSEPEPDVALLRHPAGLLSRPRAGDALLVVEVSDATLEFDRIVKSRLYARSGIVEYWIVDLVNDVVEVRRNPTGGEYASSRRIATGRLTVETMPEVSIMAESILAYR